MPLCSRILQEHYVYSKHKRRRMGPRYSSSLPRTFPLCITSILPSRAKLRAASLVSGIRPLHSVGGGISSLLDSPRGISLGQHVFPTSLFWSRFRISPLSLSSDTALKYFDFPFALVVDWNSLGCDASIFRFFAVPLRQGGTFGFVAGFDTDADDDDDDDSSTKNSPGILLLSPPSPNTIPSSSSKRRFLWTFGRSSPHSWPNPPTDRSEATTLCQGTRSEGPKGLRPMAVPTARADVRSSRAMEPYVRTEPLGMVPTTS